MAQELMNFNDLDRYAQAIVQSGFCGFTKKEEVITLALVANDEGRSLGSVARDYHVIKGRPTLKADAMLARFQQAGGIAKPLQLTDTLCEYEFTHSSCGTFKLSWTIEQAQKAGLTGNATWQKFPRAMLRARVISEGIRTALPSVICGVYTPEEVMDMEDEKPSKTTQKVTKETPVNPPKKMDSEAVDAEIVNSTPRRKTFSEVIAEERERVGDEAFNALLFEFNVISLSGIRTEQQEPFYRKIHSLPNKV